MFATGVKIKATGEFELIDSPDIVLMYYQSLKSDLKINMWR